MSAKQPDDEGAEAQVPSAQGAALQAIIPTCLADIIRQNQGEASLYLTSELQLADLTGPVTALKVRDELMNWRFLTLQIHSDQLQKRNIYVLGLRAGRIPMMTSSVRRIDFDQGLIQTKNSVYRLRMDARGAGEPPTEQLIHICATFNDWGIGPTLGVPPFFY
jgi:hypothetical protein